VTKKKNSLSEITAPVKDELKAFNDYFKKALKSNVPLVDLITKYILRQKGKKIRPLLVMLSAKLVGEINERTMRGATLVELLHTATLVHDDVVDNADKRRGLPSINAIWKNKVAVLMGDYLLSRGLMLSLENEDFDFLKTITLTVKRMSEGELHQIKRTRKLDLDEESYYRIISDKTASLLSTCAEIGARSTIDEVEKIKMLSEFGENLGIAFQIKDDILDYTGKTKLLGKPLGEDIRERKLTLPVIHALEQSSESEKKRIIGKIKKVTRGNNINLIFDFVKKHNGIEYSQRRAEEYAEKAKKILMGFEETETREALENLVDFVVYRNN